MSEIERNLEKISEKFRTMGVEFEIASVQAKTLAKTLEKINALRDSLNCEVKDLM